MDKAVTGAEKANNILDYLDDRLLGELRGSNQDFDGFVSEFKETRAAAAKDPKGAPSMFRGLKSRATSGIQKVNYRVERNDPVELVGRKGRREADAGYGPCRRDSRLLRGLQPGGLGRDGHGVFPAARARRLRRRADRHGELHDGRLGSGQNAGAAPGHGRGGCLHRQIRPLRLPRPVLLERAAGCVRRQPLRRGEVQAHRRRDLRERQGGRLAPGLGEVRRSDDQHGVVHQVQEGADPDDAGRAEKTPIGPRHVPELRTMGSPTDTTSTGCSATPSPLRTRSCSSSTR